MDYTTYYEQGLYIRFQLWIRGLWVLDWTPPQTHADLDWAPVVEVGIG